MTKIPCEVIRDLLPSYADGLTSDASNKMIEEHLEECEECRNILAAMKEGESDPEENLREIDFLKKTNTNMRRNVIKAVLGVLAAVLLITGIRVFLVGQRAHPDSIAVNVNAEGNTYTIEGDITDSALAVSGLKAHLQGDTLFVDVRTAPALFARSGKFREVHVSDEPIKRICVNDRVVYENGTVIYADTARVLETAHPYVGDMPANLKTAQAAGLYEHFGQFTNELKTDHEPYGWTIILEEPLTDPAYQETRMEKDACILLAMTENLTDVTFRYNAEGKEQEKTITVKDADEIAGFHVKDAYNDYALAQKLMK